MNPRSGEKYNSLNRTITNSLIAVGTQIVANNPALCAGASSGSVTLGGTGGNGAYEYNV